MGILLTSFDNIGWVPFGEELNGGEMGTHNILRLSASDTVLVKFTRVVPPL
ncbi:hypothetical protein D3C80_2241340 [compost metagenome]